MADNATQQGNDTIRTLDRSGVETQVSLLDVAQSGEAELLGLGDTRQIIVASAGLTTTSPTYTAGDQLGTELSFAGAVRPGRGGVIQSAVLVDKAKVVGAVDLFLFSAATTPAADNAANAWSDADMLNLLGVIHFNDLLTSANNFAVLGSNLPVVIKPGSGTTIYGDLVTRTANGVFGAVGDLQVSLGILRD
jgi:hypothetical protein